jgi:aryl-alcohol dehydrogenase-like predicted oxidoreductase
VLLADVEVEIEIATALAVLRRAVELGVDFIDTADSYGPM